ncbi:hypothetical protein ACPXB5_26785 [Micromonospora arida]|uniref:Transposase n=1 Tax=Micromonospora zamorensis TaxID=709883 RepID=A0ABZ1PKK3_9ACTN|nr:transposase [Micromonospora zamorensis]
MQALLGHASLDTTARVEIRTVICATNESLNARYRRAVKVRGH